MFKSAVYHGNSFMGEVEIYPKNSYGGAWAPREIRISHLSPPSERCPPLAVLHTVAAAGLRFKMESRATQMPSSESPPPLSLLHATCLKENKTAVVPFGEEELHLVAMFSRKNLVQYSCFWGFIVAPQLYNSCLVLLNRRCLGIVFDLDETLVVANTMRSFEDRIDALQRKISNETDPQRVTGMLAEIRCYQDDKSILKQYIENDQVAENGKVFKVQSETVPPLSDNHPTITRPVIRLQEKNIILTRVNPAIRDTSVLVRLRPAWEELRSYLTARGRKRFEVYVCTMAERDYALEMWRLLDPDSNLINSRELLDRIVCVKSGLRKSLLNVFRDGICHPKMALVIDDRLKVWDEKDQPRVHVVPAFAPYYAPQAEANNSVPILCVARNVACNVRGGFFKEFDEGLLPRISNVFYEDEMSDFPSAPDVGNYLFSDDDTPASNGSKDPLPFEGITDVEAEKRLKVPNVTIQAVTPMVNNLDPRSIPSLQHAMSSSGVVPVAVPQMVMPLPINQCSQPIPLGKPLGPTGFPEASLQSSPAREEGEVPESELDPDTRRRLLILQHGQDNRDPPLPPPPPPPPPPFQLRSPHQVSVPTAQSSGGWFPLNKEISPRQHKRAAKEFPLESEAVHFTKRRSQHSSFSRGGDNTIPLDRGLNGNQQYPVQARWGDDRLRSNHTVSNYNSFTGKEMPVGRIASNPRDAHLESSWGMTKYAETPAGVLHEIAMKSEAKVEYRTAVSDSTELQFSVEIWFVGEKIGEGIAKTRKEARDQACEKSLKYLANKYLSDTLPDSTAVHGSLNKFYHAKENGFINDSNCFGYPTSSKNDMPVVSTSEESRLLDQRFEGSKRSLASISALKDLCTAEGFNLVFQSQPSVSESSANKCEVHAQVEVAGQILGKGIGKTWEEAKLQAAEEAHGTLKSMLGQFTQKHASSPRSLSTASNKRSKAEPSRILQRNILSSR